MSLACCTSSRIPFPMVGLSKKGRELTWIRGAESLLAGSVMPPSLLCAWRGCKVVRSVKRRTNSTNLLRLHKLFQVTPMNGSVLPFSIQSLKVETLVGLDHDDSNSIGGANLDGLPRIGFLEKG